MGTLLIEIFPQPGDLLDGITFVPATGFTYAQAGRNHYTAEVTAAGNVGVVDIREMIAELDAEFSDAMDLNAIDAQNAERVSDVVVERGLVLAAAQTVAAVGVQTPPLPGFVDGVNDQSTPNVFATTDAAVRRFGGSQYVSTAALGVRGGVVVVPTSYRFFFSSDGDSNPPRVLLWVLPLYSCCCWGPFGSTNEQGAVP